MVGECVRKKIYCEFTIRFSKARISPRPRAIRTRSGGVRGARTPRCGIAVKKSLIRTGLEALYFSGVHRVMERYLGGVGAILMLHHVRPPRRGGFQPNRLLEVTPAFLERVIRLLQRSSIDIVSLDEMYRRLADRDFGRRFACVTFEDGYRDTKTWAYPILKKYAVPFAIYVPTSFPDRLGELWWLTLEAAIANTDRMALLVDGKGRRFDCSTVSEKRHLFSQMYWWLRSQPSDDNIRYIARDLAARYNVDVSAINDAHCMSWQEIRELAADPLVTIGAHTVNHPILAKASDAVVRSELKMGRAVVEAAIGVRPEHLAYPFGDRSTVGAREFQIAAELGFKTAVTTESAMLFPEHREQMTALPRIPIDGELQRGRYVRVLMSGTATAMFDGFGRVEAA
jgi:peptidoglycan/xylan/chitin deacetylase (PgdA/CDA1 family)